MAETLLEVNDLRTYFDATMREIVPRPGWCAPWMG